MSVSETCLQRYQTTNTLNENGNVTEDSRFENDCGNHSFQDEDRILFGSDKEEATNTTNVTNIVLDISNQFKPSSTLDSAAKATIAGLKRIIKTLETEQKAYKQEVIDYKCALARSNECLTRNNIPIPENSIMVDGKLPCQLDTNVKTLSFPVWLRPETDIPINELPFKLYVANYPNVTSITEPTRFSSNVGFPRGVTNHERTKDCLVPTLESRSFNKITCRLVNRMNPNAYVDEKQLLPDVTKPRITFELKLLYARDFSEVELDTLNNTSENLTSMASPNIIGCRQTMKNGIVEFGPFKLNVLSSMTTPKDEKLIFAISCVNESLKRYEHLHCKTVPFLSVARIRMGAYNESEKRPRDNDEV